METPNTINAFAVYDLKAQLYAQPLFMKTKGLAIRAFSQACEDKNTELNKHPTDFSLYHLGTYNVETGSLNSLNKPLQIANASEFVEK